MSARTPPPCPLCAGHGVPLGALGSDERGATLVILGKRQVGAELAVLEERWLDLHSRIDAMTAGG